MTAANDRATPRTQRVPLDAYAARCEPVARHCPQRRRCARYLAALSTVKGAVLCDFSVTLALGDPCSQFMAAAALPPQGPRVFKSLGGGA